jgi:uncharacterized membrane protein YjjP (DUF1212 family)
VSTTQQPSPSPSPSPGFASATAGTGRPPASESAATASPAGASPSGTPSPTGITATPVSPTPSAPASGTATSTVSGGLLVTALVVLAAAAWIGWHMVRRWRVAGEQPRPAPATGPTPHPAASELVALLTELGTALNAAGESVGLISRRLRTIAGVYGAPDAELLILPNALMVQLPGEEHGIVGMSTRASDQLQLDQVTALFKLADRLEAGAVGIDDARLELAGIWRNPHRFGPVVQALGHGVLSAGIVLTLAPSVIDLIVGFVLGCAVGALRLWRPRNPSLQTLFPVIGAFGVSVVALFAVEHGLRVDPVGILIAPIVTFIPGAALTTATIELSDGQMVAGAARLVQSGLQLVLLAFGILAGAQLVHITQADVDGPVPTDLLGAAAPFVGVFCFAVGMFVFRSGARGAFGWTLLVLYVAYSAQVIGAATVGGYLSGFVGAAVMTPVAMLVAAQPGGPPLMATFLPAFWLLVPGSIGLIGVAEVLVNKSTGQGTVLTAGVSIVAIALGVITGLGVAGVIDRRSRRRLGTPSQADVGLNGDS